MTNTATNEPKTSAMPARVSIGMPVYNGETYLAQSIESVLAQTYRDFELIIADNASTDSTQAICEKYAAQDSRIRYCRAEANQGAAWNYNRLVGLAHGEYFKWQPHDDILQPTNLERCVDFLDAHAEAVLVYPQTRLIDDKGEFLRDIDDRLHVPDSSPHERFGRALGRMSMCSPVLGMSRIKVLKRTRLIDRFQGSDYVLLAEMAILGQIHELPGRLFLRRMHKNSSQLKNPAKKEIRRWLDPNARGRLIASPSLRIFMEFGRSAWKMQLGPLERVRCLMALHRWPMARLRDIAGKYKKIMKKSLHLRSA